MEAGPAVSLSPRGVLGDAAARTCFVADGVEVTVGDALAASDARGEWGDALAACTAALAAWDSLDETGRAAVEESLPRREMLLRRDRRLTSADDYLAWLGTWGLDVAACRAHLRRTLALEARPAPGPTTPPDGETLAEVLRAHVVVTGFVERAQRSLAEDMALAEAPVDSAADRDAVLAEVVAQGARERARRPDDEVLARILAERALDWTLVDALLVRAPDDDVAREVIACVVVDGTPLDQVAADAGLPRTAVRGLLEDLPAPVRLPVAGAAPGDVVGPVAHDDARFVVAVRERIPPSLEDDTLRAKASAAALERTIAAGLARRVRWGTDG